MTESNEIEHPWMLVTGGVGYIGSHTVLALLESGLRVLVVDNLVTSDLTALDRVAFLAFGVEKFEDQNAQRRLRFEKADLSKFEELESVFLKYKNRISSVVHLASLKSVSESLRQPMRYYEANVVGTLNLLRCCEDHGIAKVLFSSSASIYGDTQEMPVKEDGKRGPLISVYAETKHFCEESMQRLAKASDQWKIIALRYFNPIGAHPTGLLGEDFRGLESNLLPILSRVAKGKQPSIVVFGKDYETRDGTPIRDYVHVMDVARGHVVALKQLELIKGFMAYNLGSGTGSTVLEIISAFESASSCKIPIEYQSRRNGDVAVALADIRLAAKELDWTPTYSLDQMMIDYWRFTTMNPNGYDSTDSALSILGKKQN